MTNEIMKKLNEEIKLEKSNWNRLEFWDAPLLKEFGG